MPGIGETHNITGPEMQPQMPISKSGGENLTVKLPAQPSKAVNETPEMRTQIDNLEEPKGQTNLAITDNLKGTAPSGLKDAVGNLAARIFSETHIE